MRLPSHHGFPFVAPLIALACSNEAVVGGRLDAATDLGHDVTSDLPHDVSKDTGDDVTSDVYADVDNTDINTDINTDGDTPDVAPCTTGESRCGDRCVDTATDRQNCGACGHACEVGQMCTDGACACATGTTSCNGACVDTATSPTHCGACGQACPAGQACMTGRCVCPTGQTRCGDACVDTQASDAHCGTCERACAADQRCAMGACACNGGLSLCAGACVDTERSDTHCGACGHACPAGQHCAMGTCECPTGQTRCGDACVDVQSDRANCGACGRACSTEQHCAMGTCECPGGQTHCGDACVDLRSDRANCGACGRACPAGQHCAAGVCRIECNAPEVDCTVGSAMVCVDTRTDVNHCGGCNAACATPTGAASAACRAGACTAVCAGGRGDCDGAFANGCETDTTTSATHCGRCGNACPASAPDATTVGCTAGACVATCRTGRGDCDGALANGCETDITTTPAHCGRCGNACATGEACVGGRCLPRSCAAAHMAFPTAASGVYRIDPDGPGGVADFDVYCDMTTADGGWTLLATVYNTLPTDTRRWNTDAVFQDDSVFGDLATRATDDFKSPAYARVSARDLLVLTEEYHFGFNGLLGGTSLGAFIRARVTPMCATEWIRSGVDFASSNVPADVRRALGFTIRGLDVNGGGPMNGCAVEGTNENSFLNFLAGPSWWVFGPGNCVRCAGGWTTYDNGMLNLASIMTATCTPGTWPCNANGLWWQSSIYPSNPDTKTRYVQLLVR